MLELRTLLELRQATPLSFSRDGAALLIDSNLPGTRQLFLVPVRGGALCQLTDFPEPVSGRLLRSRSLMTGGRSTFRSWL